MSIEKCFLLIVLTINTVINGKMLGFSAAPIACDFDKFLETGCEDSVGSYCDLENSRCLCKKEYPIRLFKYCLRYVGINETCYTSRQCNETLNAACYILGTEYDHSGGHNVGFQLSDWPEGKCRCRLGHQFDAANETCIKRTIGSWCNTDRDCTKENFHSFCNKESFICQCVYGYIYDPIDDTCSPQRLYGSKCRSSDDCARDQLVCTSGRCKCPKGMHWDAIYPGNLCKPKNDSACAYGYRWDSEKERCVLKLFYTEDDGLEGTDTISLSGIGTVRGGSNRGGNGSDDNSSSMSTASILAISAVFIAIIIVILRYCYIKKREESDDDLVERGMIRPTLKPYGGYGEHLIHQPAIDTNGIKCPLYVETTNNCDGIKCSSPSSHSHHSPHPPLTTGYECPIGHCQGHCQGHIDLGCEVVGCHQVDGPIGEDGITPSTLIVDLDGSQVCDGSIQCCDDPDCSGCDCKADQDKDYNDDGLGSMGNQESLPSNGQEEGNDNGITKNVNGNQVDTSQREPLSYVNTRDPNDGCQESSTSDANCNASNTNVDDESNADKDEGANDD